MDKHPSLAVSAIRKGAELPNAGNVTRSLWAVYLNRNKQYREAEVSIKKIVEDDPENVFYKKILYEILLTNNKCSEAREELYSLLNNNPNRDELYHLIENSYKKRSKHQKSY